MPPLYSLLALVLISFAIGQPHNAPLVSAAAQVLGPSSTPTFTVTPTPYTPSPIESITSVFTPNPAQSGLPSDCRGFYQATSGDTCQSILSRFKYITEKQLHEWNPVLKNDCSGFWAGYYYCVAAYPEDGVPPVPSVLTATPSPRERNITSNCKAWYQVIDNSNCKDILNKFGTFTKKDFVAWNPTIREDCSGLKRGYWYCVAVQDTPATHIVPWQPLESPKFYPRQPNVAMNCNKWWLVSRGQTCETVAYLNSISLDDFFKWNPDVGVPHCNNLLADYEVCVGVAPDPTSTSTVNSTTTIQPTTTSPGAVSTPTPIQPGMIAGCTRFYYVKRGDNCWAISVKVGIDLDDFLHWNPAVGADCSKLFPGFYVCIGISGQQTTITGFA
ncbi:hypothetical protein BDV29DRAFT_155828 [Aspergillus leporis]|uniref:LysM domain-containing protein n=1 Tax=Aspergillus leporis TaxID=41062 RepID=A0A5N5X547_9EURO|nr:hypothetical protein BDV29DRAFT_155828 [Aspergillus leporis]